VPYEGVGIDAEDFDLVLTRPRVYDGVNNDYDGWLPVELFSEKY